MYIWKAHAKVLHCELGESSNNVSYLQRKNCLQSRRNAGHIQHPRLQKKLAVPTSLCLKLSWQSRGATNVACSLPCKVKMLACSKSILRGGTSKCSNSMHIGPSKCSDAKVALAQQSAATKVGSSKSAEQTRLGQSSPTEPTEPLATNHVKVEYA